MKTFKALTLKALALVSLLVVAAIPSMAQTATTQTILAAAMSSGNPGSSGCFSVASATGFSASTQTATYYSWVDGELIKNNSVSGTTICGTRGYIKTRSTPHPTASVVFTGQAGLSANGIGYPFTSNSPYPGTSCTATQYGYLPIINYTDGSISNCLPIVGSTAVGTVNAGAYSRWITYSFNQWAYGHPVTTIVDAAYTATLADEFLIMSRLTSARTITLPPITGVLGKTMIIKNNTESALTITVAASANQGVGTTGSNTVVVNASAAGLGNVLRVVSVATSAGGWSWATW